MYLTKRQQRILGEITELPGFKSADRKGLWCLGLAEDYTSSATLYRLVDAALAGLGTDDGDEIVAATVEGEELAALLTSLLTKRQQQVLMRLRDGTDPDGADHCNNVWILPAGSSAMPSYYIRRYGAQDCGWRTMHVLCDAELIGYFFDDGEGMHAALTPRGRRLAELLP